MEREAKDIDTFKKLYVERFEAIRGFCRQYVKDKETASDDQGNLCGSIPIRVILDRGNRRKHGHGRRIPCKCRVPAHH